MSNKSVQGWESGTYVIITIFDDRPPPPTAAAAAAVAAAPLNVFPRTSTKHITCTRALTKALYPLSWSVWLLCCASFFLINDDRF